MVLKKYQVQYFQCSHCGFVQTESPYWLQEAYSEAIASSDVGMLSRSTMFSNVTNNLIFNLFDRAAKFLDWGGGYGVFVRMMRDLGYDFYWHDKYCKNIFAGGFAAEENSSNSYELVTAFEVFEHFVNPQEEIEQLFRFSRNILFSTKLLPVNNPKPGEWWYYALDEGQHVSIYTAKALAILAQKFNLNFYSNGDSLHLFTAKEIPHQLFRSLSACKEAESLQPSLLQQDYETALRKIAERDNRQAMVANSSLIPQNSEVAFSKIAEKENKQLSAIDSTAIPEQKLSKIAPQPSLIPQNSETASSKIAETENKQLSAIDSTATPPKKLSKIAIDGVFFQLNSTGIARVWKSLLENWATTDFAKQIIVLDRGGSAPKIPGIEYRTIARYNYSNTDADRQMLQQICDVEKIDLFISTYYTTPLSTRSVFTAYDMIPEFMGQNLTHLEWREKHCAIRHASAWMAISENTARDLVRFFPQIPLDAVAVAHCGIDANFSPVSPAAIAAFKSKYGIAQPYFLLVGERVGWRGYKNGMLFCKAFAQLANKFDFD
ncbi:MAG: methyltransferase domain-containing protein, partial [Microcoleus sp.]